jgi:diaminopimelate decarboxylase
MTELLRPALYGARHGIVALTSLGRPIDRAPAFGDTPGIAVAGLGRGLQSTRVEGPICESTDSLGVHDLPPLRRGDLVAIADAGAYAASQSSTYNGRARPPQVLLDPKGGLTLGRRRLG